MPINLPIRVYCDNQTAIDIINNHVQHDKTKHVEVSTHFIKEKLQSGLICVPYVYWTTNNGCVY